MMGWLRSFVGGPNAERRPAPESKPSPESKRGYAAAQFSRYAAFEASLEPAHRELQRDLTRLRAHSRDLAKNNAYLRRYAQMVKTHVVGPEGIAFESEITGNLGKPKQALNDAIEQGWVDWGRSVSADGRLSWVDFQQLVAVTVAVDGECLIRLIRSHQLLLEIIDADRLDWTYNRAADARGNRVVMGVEIDAWGKPIAYHLHSHHPGDFGVNRKRLRVPASEILHVYAEDRARATRGVPWAASVMVQVNMLGKLWTAELAAANWEANRLGVVKTQQGVPLDELDEGIAQAAAAEIQSEVCAFVGLDAGLDIQFPTNQHPNGAFPEFSRYLLKGIAAGLGVSYHSLAADVSDANYSSARVALLEERDVWRTLQGWFIRQVCQPIFEAWLEMAVLTGAVPVPAVPVKKLCQPRWYPRSWDWVDPLKDAQASILSLQAGLTTYQAVLGAMGRDWRDVFKQLHAEEAERKALGLSLSLEGKKENKDAEKE